MRVLKTHDKLNKFGIPLGYTRVEYLQSTGVQYIDTGVKTTSNLRIIIKFKANETPNTFKWAFAGRDNAIAGDGFGFGADASGYITSDYNGRVSDTVKITNGTTYTVDKNKNVCKYNDSVLTNSETTFNYNHTIYLMGMNNQGSFSELSALLADYYYCQIWDDGTLVRDFIPCLDLLGKPCLYDLVEQKSYYNLGSGADFTVGRKIIPVEYLEANGGQYIDTGIQPTDDYGYRIRNTYTVGGGEQCAIGCMDSGNRFVGVYTSGARNQLSGAWGSDVGFLPEYSWNTGDILDVETNYKNSRKIIVSGTELKDISDIHITGTISNTLYLFARHYSNTITTMKGKIYGVELTKGLDTVANYIPCKDENNVGFIFDTVENNVYLNIGTGSFIVGEEVYDYKDTVRFIKDSITEDLPRGYTRIEYIEAANVGMTDIQYAVGNYRLTDTTDWEITFSAAHSGNSWVIGQPAWIGVHYRKDATTNNLPRVGITNKADTTSQCYVDYTNNEKITLALKGTDVYANGVKAGSIIRISAASTQTKYGIFAYKDISQDLPNLRIESAKIYDIKIWDNNILVQHLVPVLDINGEGCFYDTVNKITIRKEDNCTSDFTTGSKVSSGLRLLAGGSIEDYIFLDYLESTGTQYIDTGCFASDTSKVIIDGKCSSTNSAFIGSGTSSSANDRFIVNTWSTSLAISSRMGSVIESSNILWDNRHTVEADLTERKFVIDGTETITLGSTDTLCSTYTMYLFCANYGSSVFLNQGKTIYNCQIYDNNTLVRNFLPALRKSDSKPGMYDMVEGKFYVNQATGADFNYGYKQ